MNDLTILYHDKVIVVVDKPAGLLSVPGRGSEKQYSAVSIVKEEFPCFIDYPAVHRLDMDTSGIMLLALTKEAHRTLSIDIEKRQFYKEYTALVSRELKNESGRIELAFRLDINNRPKQIYDPVKGKLGITEWQKLRLENGQTRVLFKPLTGRTHQLRVHSAHPLGLNAAIVGDRLYGERKEGERMCLHATLLEFQHPTTKKLIRIKSPVPF